MQRSFSQNAAHEFRTPLAVLKTRIGLFRKKQDFAPQTTEAFLSIMESEVDRLSGMVDSLLKLTNLDRCPAATESNWENCSTKLPRMFPLWPAKGHRHFGGSPPPGTITGSRELLRRALFNLVENAVKYGPDGGQTRLCAELNGADIVITVANQGPCIPPELRERIFEPFFRADTAAPGNWGVSAWGWPWSGPLQKSTAAAYGWRKIRLAGIDFWSGFRQYVYEGEPSGHRKACYAIDNLNNFHLFFAILLRLICFPATL